MIQTTSLILVLAQLVEPTVLNAPALLPVLLVWLEVHSLLQELDVKYVQLTVQLVVLLPSVFLVIPDIGILPMLVPKHVMQTLQLVMMPTVMLPHVIVTIKLTPPQTQIVVSLVQQMLLIVILVPKNVMLDIIGILVIVIVPFVEPTVPLVIPPTV